MVVDGETSEEPGSGVFQRVEVVFSLLCAVASCLLYMTSRRFQRCPTNTVIKGTQNSLTDSKKKKPGRKEQRNATSRKGLGRTTLSKRKTRLPAAREKKPARKGEHWNATHPPTPIVPFGAVPPGTLNMGVPGPGYGSRRCPLVG